MTAIEIDVFKSSLVKLKYYHLQTQLTIKVRGAYSKKGLGLRAFKSTKSQHDGRRRRRKKLMKSKCVISLCSFFTFHTLIYFDGERRAKN